LKSSIEGEKARF